MKKVIRYVVLSYAVLCGAFYFYQHLFFFQPKALDAKHVLSFPMQLKYTTSKIPFDANTSIDVVKFLPKDTPSRGVVLFFHGNRFNVEHYSTYAPYFTAKGYECWMPDYPGYGRSTGEISIPLLQELSEQLYKMARARFAAEQITLYGKSLGTGVATYLASVKDCRAVVLETPYYSLELLAAEYMFMLPVKYLMKYNLDSYAYLANTRAPVTIMHGSRDEVIPLSNAGRLMAGMKPEDAAYIIEGGRHNNLPAYPLYHQVLDSVLAAQ